MLISQMITSLMHHKWPNTVDCPAAQQMGCVGDGVEDTGAVGKKIGGRNRGKGVGPTHG